MGSYRYSGTPTRSLGIPVLLLLALLLILVLLFIHSFDLILLSIS